MANHPLHPAAVHWPIALISTAFGVDLLNALHSYIPSAAIDYLPQPTELTVLSYYALSAGLLSGVAAVVTGVVSASRMMTKAGSILEADKKTLKPKFKTLFAHAALNDLALVAGAGYWWLRRQSGGPVYVPEIRLLGLGGAVVAVQLFAARLGGILVYGYGAGIGGARPKGKAQ
ncbi:hypothetical protein F1880_003642 [Penicillium rolfsii]|nr:hypothetical protein F1880_003642 [Penicillium rolfsii]